jgi:hypothetical protein
MDSWRDKLKSASDFLKRHQLASDSVSYALNFVPILGPFLKEVYDKALRSGQDKSGDILKILQSLQKNNEDDLQKLMDTVQDNQLALLGDKDILTKLVASNGDIADMQQQIKSDLIQLKIGQRSLIRNTQRIEENTQRVLDDMKVSENHISCLHLNLMGVENCEAVLGKIAHVNITVGDQSIPFVSFDNINNTMERASRGAGLFITGLSGSGKSRVLFETTKNTKAMLILGEKMTLEQIKSAAESAGGKASVVIDSTLYSAKKKAEDFHVLLWDNFPDGLVNTETLSSVKNALEMVASVNNTQVVISLDPKFYAKYSDLAKEIASVTTVNVSYTKDEFGTVFRTIGKVYLGLDYEKKIGANENKIIDKLFAKWGLPKYIESYFALATQEDDAVSLAEKLGDQKYEDWAADQFRLLRARNVNLNFLYAIKLANLFGEDNDEVSLKKLQSKYLGTCDKDPDPLLENWFYMSSGSCVMHDLDLNALDFDHSAKLRIFSYIQRGGFEQFIRSRDDRLDWSGYVKLGKFFAKNTKYFIFNDLMTGAIGAFQTQEPIQAHLISALIEGIGVEFNSLTNAEKTLFLQHAKDSGFIAPAEGTGVGSIFGSLSDDYKREVLEIARVNPEFAGSLGLTIGNSFGSLSDEYKTKALGLAQENPEFAEWFGWGVGRSFGSLSDEYKTKALGLAQENPEFVDALRSSAPYLTSKK